MTDIHSSLVTFVGDEILLQEEGDRPLRKWSSFVDGKDGFLYGIPNKARAVVKFNPADKSMEFIRTRLEENYGWECGVLAKNGCIYCPPYYHMKMLKINTIDGTVETFDIGLLLPGVGLGSWMSGVVGPDGCIYYMPRSCNHILRVDPSTDFLASISIIELEYSGFKGTVLGKDGCIYGLPYGYSGRVMRFDPMEPENISYFEEDDSLNFGFYNDGVLGNDGNIYGLNYFGQVLKVDTSERTVSLIEKPYSNDGEWGDPVVGVDQCIYWPPKCMKQVLKFDPATQEPPSLVGSIVVNSDCFYGWVGGVLANDGVIYCVPSMAKQVLAIDPLRELSVVIKESMRQYPEDLGRLFVQSGEYYRESLFDSTVRKFGHDRALNLLDECLSFDDEGVGRLPLFMLAASIDNAPLSVPYHLMRSNVHDLFTA